MVRIVCTIIWLFAISSWLTEVRDHPEFFGQWTAKANQSYLSTKNQ